MKKIFLISFIWVGIIIPQKITAQNLQFNKILCLDIPGGGSNSLTGLVPNNQIFKIVSLGACRGVTAGNPSVLTMAIDTTGGVSLTNDIIIAKVEIINSTPTDFQAPLPIWLPSGASYEFDGVGLSCTGRYFLNIIVYDIIP